MLDEKDLQAIAQLMAGMEQRMDQKLTQQKREIIGEVKVLIEADVLPKFDLLAEKMDLLQEKLVPAEALDDAEERLDLLEATVRRHSKEIAQLKKAQ